MGSVPILYQRCYTGTVINQSLLVLMLARDLYADLKRTGERERDLNECMAIAVINFQYGCHVATPITIIWRTKDGDHFLFL